jgi:hypothetical protein
MKVSEKIEFTINKLPRGYIFTYSNFNTDVNEQNAVALALGRMVASGKIKKLSNGKFYKPEITPFGEVQPNQYQIVKDLLVENGKTIGYLTGLTVYNELGLTSQISNTIQIGKNQVRPSFRRGRYVIRFIKQKNTITNKNVPMLQILDAIRFIKQIPDSDIKSSFYRLIDLIKNLSQDDITTLVRLALRYPPSTRALLGAMLDDLNQNIITEVLFKSLNPMSKYSVPGLESIIPTAEKWNLK